MQQASSSIGTVTASAGTSFAPKPANPPRFVVNLCASTTPVGLVQPTHAGLKRFTFFVSRRLEEGRERFRLHMGYFDSQEEAEKMLDLVRDVYPGAWAGAAPGLKLRARAALPEPAPAEVPAAPPVAAAARSVAPAPKPVDTKPAELPRAETSKPASAQKSAPAQPVSKPVLSPMRLELAPDLPRAHPKSAAAASASQDAANSLSAVRATIASLGDSPDAPTTASAAAAPADAELDGAAVLHLLTSARPAPAARLAPPHAPASRAKQAPAQKQASRPAAEPAPPPTAAQPEPALFAVQLLWSVQPIDMGQVPQLAIFSAYTLYGAEGNRDGRRWYGLRLGFFTDAVSAKQVAQYVRSEFTSVSVVPVTERERTRAGAAPAKTLPPPVAPKSSGPELNFINDVATDTATSGSRPALGEAEAPKSPPTLRPAASAALNMGAKATPGKRAKLRNPPAPSGKKSARPLSLEETLEILGAGQLQIANDRRRDLLSESAVRDRRQPEANGSRFGRLINRLAERFGNG